jgi:hypothetical protein
VRNTARVGNCAAFPGAGIRGRADAGIVRADPGRAIGGRGTLNATARNALRSCTPAHGARCSAVAWRGQDVDAAAVAQYLAGHWTARLANRRGRTATVAIAWLGRGRGAGSISSASGSQRCRLPRAACLDTGRPHTGIGARSVRSIATSLARTRTGTSRAIRPRCFSWFQTTAKPVRDPVFVVSNHGNGGQGPGFRGFKPRRSRSRARFSWFQTTAKPVKGPVFVVSNHGEGGQGPGFRGFKPRCGRVVTGVFRGLVGGEDD